MGMPCGAVDQRRAVSSGGQRPDAQDLGVFVREISLPDQEWFADSRKGAGDEGPAAEHRVLWLVESGGLVAFGKLGYREECRIWQCEWSA